MTQQQAKNIRKAILDSSDTVATTISEVFPELTESGSDLKAGTRIKWTDGKLYSVKSDSKDEKGNNPSDNPTNWAEVTG